MENSGQKHDGGGTSKKWKSLDLDGPYEETSEGYRRAGTGNAKLYSSGGTRSTEEKTNSPVQSKSNICRRRDVSLGVFQSESKRRRKDSGISRSFTYGLDLGTEKPHNLNGSSSGPCISHSVYNVSDTLDNVFALPPVRISKSNLSCSNMHDPSTWGGDINIPRRPRGVLRRRNSPFNIKDAPFPFSSIGKSGSGTHNGTLSSDLATSDQPVQLLVSNKNKRCDELEENGPSGCYSLEHFKWENGNLVQAVQKGAQRNHRKRQYTTTGKLKQPVSSQPFGDSAKCSNNCHEDDEESLEQNAARMLSSRFDPRCTGISGDKSGISSRSYSKSSSSASSSLEIAGRVLRPRKQNEKGSFRKRRHFYEVCSAGVDPYWVLKRRIRVFWPLDKSWYFGLVKGYDPKTKLHHVKYDDRDEEWINLQNERFKLLLLPSEFSCKFDSEKLELKSKEETKPGIVSAIDDNCSNSFLESEPIISWLARSVHRVKKSSLRILKERRRSHLKKNLYPSQGHAIGCPLSTNSRRPILVMPDRSTDEKASKVTPLKTKNCCDDRKFTIVYFRRRFHKMLGTVEDKLEESPPWSLSESLKLAPFDTNGVGSPAECNVMFTALKPGEGTLKCILPFLWLPSLAWLYENSWLYKIFSLNHHGKLVITRPVVCMEIVFLDNRRGLRFLSFTGYVQHAVAVICVFIKIFHVPSRCTKFAEPQLPFTSIGFRLWCVQGEGRQLLFYVYNFLDMEKSSQWLYLGRKLKQFSVTVKELPFSECTYANVKNFFCANEKRPSTSDFWEQITVERLQKPSCRGFVHHLQSNISASSHTSLPYFKLNGQDKNHPFLLSLATIPAMFLFLHFKLLVEKNEDSLSSKISNAMPLLDCPDNYEKFTDECCSPVEDSSDQFSETRHENFGYTLNHAVVSSRWLSCPRSKLGTDALSIGNDCDLMRSSDISLNNELNLNRNSAVHRDLGERVSEESDSQFQIHPFSKLCQDVGNPCSPLEDISSPEESEGDCSSFMNTPKIQTQRSQSEDNLSERGAHALEKSAFLSWSANGCTDIHSPKPTAPGTIWHRNRQNHMSASVVNHSKFWPENWEGYINGYKKPRTQVSYISPFGGSGNSPRSQNHHQKGRPSKKLKNDNAKRIVAGSKNLENDLDSLCCNANVLVTTVDRGWREFGAHVSLEFDDHKDWQILVKLSGLKKYSYKAHQFWQPGTTNRFTHAMMWKGGKDWTLEFTDRSQWSLFKELYEECYNQNIRAASIRNIPIPGVRLIQDSDDYAGEVPFACNSAKYFRQIGTEVDMALDPSHVLYDMDSEDEEWISNLRNSADDDGRMLQGISDDTFEKAMDMFEKVAFAQHCNEFTDAEIESFMAEVGPVEVMKAVHEHWQGKRQKKGMPLIRQFQPALWEQYQQQVKEWESTVSKMHNWSNGGNDRAFSIEKPPMFAFCLRPQGLKVPNKGSKQRSHKKLPVNGHHSVFARENYNLQGKKLNGYPLGKEKASVVVPNCEFPDVPWLQSPTGLSHRDPVSGFTAFANGSSDRSHHLRLEGNISKNMVMSACPRDHRTMSTTNAQRKKSSGIYRLNTGFSDRLTATQYKSDGFHRHQSDIDEFMLRDASSAAQHASNMAKLKREKAQWLTHKADLAIHRAVVALMTADAIKASEDDIKGDG